MKTTTTIMQANGYIKQLPQGNRRTRFLASHQRPDRDKQVILLSGLDTSAYMRNPVLLIQHDWTSKAVGRVESLRIAAVDGFPALLGEAFFPERPASTEAYEDVVAGLYNAVSVGLLIHEQGRPIMEGQLGVTITKSELMEISLVSIPACASCLISKKEYDMKSACNCTELDLTPELAAKIPAMVDQAVSAALRTYTRPPTRHDEIDLDDPEVRRVLADLPSIVRNAFHAAVAQEVRTALRRLQGKVD